MDNHHESHSPHVPGQFLGYSLQTTRFCCKLLEAKRDSFVSLEVFDDVGIETFDGYKYAEQTKSSTSSRNPASNLSEDLWKTFNNWIDSVENNELDVDKTYFEYYVSRQSPGDLVCSFSEAKTPEEVLKVIQVAKQKLQEYITRSGGKSNATKYITRFLSANDSLLCKIIQNFTYSYGSGSPQSDLKEIIRHNPLVPDEIVDDLLFNIQGWVKNQVDLLLEKGKPAVISVNEFAAEIQSFVRTRECRQILCSFAKSPSEQEIQNELPRTYVQQLDIIDCDFDDKLRAINDFIRAAVTRTEYGKRGIVNRDTFKDFEDRLVRRWKNNRTRISLTQKELSAEEHGMLLLAECSSCSEELLDQPPPGYFISGSFHALSENLTIGWHLDYKRLLEKKG